MIQYRVCKELSTWWQRAGRAGRSLSVNAIAILLVEPCFFDDEKEKILKKAAEKARVSKNVAAGQKRAPEGQLQPAATKQSRSSMAAPAAPHATSTKLFETVERMPVKIDPEMDNFINAERRPANDRRKIANTHFGNDNLGTKLHLFD